MLSANSQHGRVRIQVQLLLPVDYHSWAYQEDIPRQGGFPLEPLLQPRPTLSRDLQSAIVVYNEACRSGHTEYCLYRHRFAQRLCEVSLLTW